MNQILEIVDVTGKSRRRAGPDGKALMEVVFVVKNDSYVKFVCDPPNTNTHHYMVPLISGGVNLVLEQIQALIPYVENGQKVYVVKDVQKDLYGFIAI